MGVYWLRSLGTSSSHSPCVLLLLSRISYCLASEPFLIACHGNSVSWPSFQAIAFYCPFFLQVTPSHSSFPLLPIWPLASLSSLDSYASCTSKQQPKHLKNILSERIFKFDDCDICTTFERWAFSCIPCRKSGVTETPFKSKNFADSTDSCFTITFTVSCQVLFFLFFFLFGLHFLIKNFICLLLFTGSVVLFLFWSPPLCSSQLWIYMRPIYFLS